MKRFAVVVNHKYIVTVEAETNGGAEHRILDKIRNCQSVLSFDINEIKTDVFRDLFNLCETISFEELKRKDDDIRQYESQVKILEMSIKQAEEEIAIVTQQRKKFAREYGFNDMYFSESQIEAICSDSNGSDA